MSAKSNLVLVALHSALQYNELPSTDQGRSRELSVRRLSVAWCFVRRDRVACRHRPTK